ncbi:hypothetical protein HMI56_001538 [Coelomomyces lativittatus]|nr:hypothetical protein HMI56_001538 [Coelomomyces lativittatus]
MYYHFFTSITLLLFIFSSPGNSEEFQDDPYVTFKNNGITHLVSVVPFPHLLILEFGGNQLKIENFSVQNVDDSKSCEGEFIANYGLNRFAILSVFKCENKCPKILTTYIVDEFLDTFHRQHFVHGLEGKLIIRCSIKMLKNKNYQNHVFQQNAVISIQGPADPTYSTIYDLFNGFTSQILSLSEWESMNRDAILKDQGHFALVHKTPNDYINIGINNKVYTFNRAPFGVVTPLFLGKYRKSILFEAKILFFYLNGPRDKCSFVKLLI